MQAYKPQHTGAAALVLRALKAMGCATKQQLAQATGLSVMAAGTAVEHLMEKGRVLVRGRAAATGGRPAAEYVYNADYAHALVLCAFEENGRDSLHLRTVDLMGRCVHRTARPLEQARLESFAPDVEAALTRDGKIAAMGFGLPGTQRLGRLETSDYKGLLGTQFVGYYAARFSMPVVLENDVNAAALGYCTLRGNAQIFFPG